MKKSITTKIIAATLSTLTVLSVAGIAAVSANAAQIKETENDTVATVMNPYVSYKYNNIDDAFKRAETLSGATILLNKDAKTYNGFTVPENACLNLDLGGHTLSGKNSIINMDSKGMLKVYNGTLADAENAVIMTTKNGEQSWMSFDNVIIKNTRSTAIKLDANPSSTFVMTSSTIKDTKNDSALTVDGKTTFKISETTFENNQSNYNLFSIFCKTCTSSLAN